MPSERISNSTTVAPELNPETRQTSYVNYDLWNECIITAEAKGVR